MKVKKAKLLTSRLQHTMIKKEGWGGGRVTPGLSVRERFPTTQPLYTPLPDLAINSINNFMNTLYVKNVLRLLLQL